MNAQAADFIEKRYKIKTRKRFPLSGKNGFPMPAKATEVPHALIGFDKIRTASRTNGAYVHFFLDDVRFEEKTWIKMDESTIGELSRFQGVLSPDYSVLRDMDVVTAKYNVQRSRIAACCLQEQGLKVIPTVSWGDEETFEFSFEALPKESVLAISSNGLRGDPEAKRLFQKGYDIMIEKLHPTVVVLYGSVRWFDSRGQKIKVFRNTNYKWAEGQQCSLFNKGEI